MLFSKRNVAALMGIGLTTVSAQIAQNCPTTDICYSINVPDSTASSGNGDIFLQMSAPTSLSWVGLGQGTGMDGANMFIMYASASGNNVTVSPRTTTSHNPPSSNANAKITILEGTGIVDGKMVARFKCSSCTNWGTGSMDFKQNSVNWIHASRSGSALNSDSQSVSIQQHTNDYGRFTWNIQAAKGGSSVNPFVNSGTSGGSSCIPRPTSGGSAATATNGAAGLASTNWPSAVPTQFQSAWPSQFPSQWRTAWPSAYPSGRGFDDRSSRGYMALMPRQTSLPYCDSSSTSPDGANSGSQGGLVGGPSEDNEQLLIAHGVLASSAMVIFFPFGAISIRLFSFSGVIWFHAALQILGYAIYIAGFGVGVYIATQLDYLDNYHPIIGIVVFILLFTQPLTGLIHHRSFKKLGTRTAFSHIHLWLGRLVITLGIINGGLGLKLADNTNSGKIAYGVIAGFVWLVWVAAAAFGELKRKSDAPPKYTDGPGASPRGSERGLGRASESEGAYGGNNREFYGGKERH